MPTFSEGHSTFLDNKIIHAQKIFSRHIKTRSNKFFGHVGFRGPKTLNDSLIKYQVFD
jgi:hypothetical protein